MTTTIITEACSALINRLRTEWFPTEEDAIWKQWVDYKRRESSDLINILSSDVKNSFKKRALLILLVPSAGFNFLYWKEDIGKFYGRPEFLKTLSLDLSICAAELISHFIEMLRPSHTGRPGNVVSGGRGVTVFMQVHEKHHNALCFYNECILTLLTILPEEHGEKIFSLFALNDVSSFCNMEDSSGYNPFSRLMGIDGMDERWKRKADIAMRKIVQDEIEGKSTPREKWENALSCYTRVVLMRQYYSEKGYAVELFADQLWFLLDKCRDRTSFIAGHAIASIFKLLSGDEYKQLRHRISRLVVYDDDFSVYSKETRQAADQMLAEFGEMDKDLAVRLSEAIKKADNQKKKTTDLENQEKAVEDAILAEMK